jgi:hypothetical protein
VLRDRWQLHRRLGRLTTVGFEAVGLGLGGGGLYRPPLPTRGQQPFACERVAPPRQRSTRCLSVVQIGRETRHL